MVGSVLGIPPERLRPTHHLIVDVDLDELSLSRLVMAIQETNPHFDLPSQLDVRDVTLADLHHFACVMGAGHAEPAGDER